MSQSRPTNRQLVTPSESSEASQQIGAVITSGWIGLTVSSYIIGFVAERTTLSTALLLLPAMSLLLIVVNLLLRPHLSRPVSV